jgi:hypothetical protein
MAFSCVSPYSLLVLIVSQIFFVFAIFFFLTFLRIPGQDICMASFNVCSSDVSILVRLSPCILGMNNTSKVFFFCHITSGVGSLNITNYWWYSLWLFDKGSLVFANIKLIFSPFSYTAFEIVSKYILPSRWGRFKLNFKKCYLFPPWLLYFTMKFSLSCLLDHEVQACLSLPWKLLTNLWKQASSLVILAKVYFYRGQKRCAEMY